MPNMAIYNMSGELAENVEVPDDVMGLPFNAELVHQAVVAVDHSRKRRCGKAKTRSAGSLTGAKWFRQKGLGRARHGDRNAPIFVGGGQAHGPKGIPGRHVLPRKMRRKATFTALSQQVRDGAVTLVEGIELDGISTKRFVQILADLELEGRTLMLMSPEEAEDEVLYKSARNVPDLVVRPVPHFNVRDVLWAEEIVITRAALEFLMGGGADDAE